MRLKTAFSVSGAALLCALAMPVLLGAQTAEPGSPRTAAVPKSPEKAPSQRFTMAAAPVAGLGGIDESVRDTPSPKRGVARVGVERAVPAQAMIQGVWQTAGDGSQVWRLALKSTNAMGLRVHFTNFNVSDGQVWVHDTAGVQSFGPYTGRGRFMNGEVWTEAVYSDTVEIEYKPSVAKGAESLPLPFSVQVAHLFRAGLLQSPRVPAERPDPAQRQGRFVPGSPLAQPSPEAVTEVTTQASAIPSCLLDAACHTADTTYPAVGLVNTATGYLLFSDSGSQYQCSGTLLNAPNGAPILLTAGHCINTTANVQSLTAAFGYVNSSCDGTAPNPSALPQILGERILSVQNSPFVDNSTLAAMIGDIDYSLVLMSGFPSSPGFTMAGYSTTEIGFGTNVTSLSYPGGYPLRFAYAPRVDSTLRSIDPSQSSYFANAYQIEFNTIGRTDDGSSGSGIFDNAGHLLGSLSTGVVDCSNPDSSGNCPANSNACSVPGAYDTWYQKFGPVYQAANSYLEQSIPPLAATNPSVFSASPNPLTSSNGLGTVTLTFNAPSGVSSTEIHVGSPTGTLMAALGASGTATAGPWVRNGLQFYLQDVTNSKPLTAANTLGIVTVTVITGNGGGQGSTDPSIFSASPNPIFSPSGLGATTLTFNAPGSVSSVEIHVNAPDGTLLSRSGPTGTAETGTWVRNGLQFFLQDVSNGKPLTSANTLAVVTATVNTVPSGTLTANPSTIVTPNGGPLGQTTLTWLAPDSQTTQLWVGSPPTGALFAQGGNSGTATTGEWVVDGTVFYLVDVSNGAASPQNVISSVTVHVNPSGGSTIGSGSTSIYLNPNPIVVTPGQQFASSQVFWNSGGISPIQIRIGTPTGGLLAFAGPIGSATATGWVSEGTKFLLVDVATGNVLASTTAHLTTNAINLGNTQFTINPISGTNGVGNATLTWNTSVSSNVQIHENSPSGALVGQGGAAGSVVVPGVSNGTIFYLQDVSCASNGGSGAINCNNVNPLTLQFTLATVTAQVTSH